MKWLLLLWPCLAMAAPQEIEVFFLTPPASAQWEQYLSPRLDGIRVAQACEPVGDYCLDPEIGLYPRTGRAEEKKDTKFEIDEGLPQLPTATSVDRSLVNCDPKYAFDIFCGKAQAEKKVAEVSGFEVWVDTSSSMRGIDPGDGKGSCQRASFLQSLVAACGKKRPTLKGFDTSIREIDPASSCVSQGLNDAKRMIEWMEDSKAKKLIFITDVYEYQAELSAYLESKQAKIHGDRGTFPASKMQDMVVELAKACE